MLPREKLILLNLTLVVVAAVVVLSSTCNKGKQIRRRLWDYELKGGKKKGRKRERKKGKGKKALIKCGI